MLFRQWGEEWNILSAFAPAGNSTQLSWDQRLLVQHCTTGPVSKHINRLVWYQTSKFSTNSTENLTFIILPLHNYEMSNHNDNQHLLNILLWRIPPVMTLAAVRNTSRWFCFPGTIMENLIRAHYSRRFLFKVNHFKCHSYISAETILVANQHTQLQMLIYSRMNPVKKLLHKVYALTRLHK